MTGRSQRILSHWPAHMEPTRPGKLLGEVVDGLSRDLDVLSAVLAGVRRSHRLSDAPELADLLLIAARHGITLSELEPLFARFARGRELRDELEAASGTEQRDERATALTDLWGLADPRPRLPLFARPVEAGEPDLNDAAVRLATYASRALRFSAFLDAIRRRTSDTCRIHARGNGTVNALLEGAAAALSLAVKSIHHSVDRFWHAAVATDLIALERPVFEPAEQGGGLVERAAPLAASEELIGLEENPLWRAEADPSPRKHAELFSMLRQGFERVLLQVRITGKEERTIGPMLVNRDEGHGIGFTGIVPANETLVFTEEGRALLGSDDVTSYAYAWQGGCFANEGDPPEKSFQFDGPGVDAERVAVFAVATPEGALDTEFVFPHAGQSLPMPGIQVGETRLAFFVQEAHFSSVGSDEGGPVIRRVPPRPFIGFLDLSVFAPGTGEVRPSAALVALSWMEHRAFTVRVLLPQRFLLLYPEDTEGTETRRRVVQSMQRFRPVGIDLKVEFYDERWVLGEGILIEEAAADPIGRLRAGTVLWRAPEEIEA